MRAHLTNTCLQDSGDREGSVGLFWSLPDSLPSQPSFTTGNETVKLEANGGWKEKAFEQLCKITGETFEAAARGMSIHFQPLPNAFEVFGLDFMVGIEPDGELNTYLLEVNAFPDFRQTGDELSGMIEGLFEGVVDVGVKEFFGVDDEEKEKGMREGEGEMVKVLGIDLGRR
jgi:tubulin--tyrosine ligase